DSVRNYLKGLPILLLPWTPFAFIGAIFGIVSVLKKRPDASAIGVFLVLVPLLIMLPFKERKERYLAPLLGGSVILAASGVAALWDTRFRRAILPGAITIAIAASAYNFVDARKLTGDNRSAMKPFAEALWSTQPNAHLFGYQS